MQTNSSNYNIPSFARQESYDFETAPRDALSIYQELNAISEEIEKCRLRNI